MDHPALLYFGGTRTRSFPLVLIIGREPNTKLSMGTHAGAYDFREYPRAGVWNIAYSLMAESVGLKSRSLKTVCAACNASPILFGNALPLGVESKVANKSPHRVAVQSQVGQHIKTLFSFKDLILRVELVIMSGLYGEQFATSREGVITECRNRGLHLASVPFFFGPNRAKIKQTLADADSAKMKTITSAFLAHCPGVGEK